MRGVFIPNPHVRMDRPWGTPYVPLELLSVMAVAEQAGMGAELCDVNHWIEEGELQVTPALWDTAAERVAKREPALVVAETWTGTFHHTVLLLRALRSRVPDAAVVLLGAGTSALAEEVLARLPEVDCVIRGEGEPALAVLARAHGGRRLPQAPGLVRRTDRGVEGAELAFVEDLDALPRPAFQRSFLRPGDSIPLEAGRGCEIGCSFCALAGHWSRRYRPRRPESLAKEMIEVARRYPGSALDLTQDVRFFCDGERIRMLSQHLRAHPHRPRWTCHARVDAMSAEDLEAMAEAGCCGILFGVETGCPTMQARIGKQVDLTRLMPALAVAKRLAIETRVSFMVGFPEEDASSLAKTARAMLDARRAGAADTTVQVVRAPPGSRLFEDSSERCAFEPLLCVASACDREARDLIASDPRLYSASYRVPSVLPREQVLAAWLALGLLGEPIAALVRQGADLDALLAALAVDRQEEDLDQALAEVARQILQFAQKECFVDPVALEDLLAYHRAVAAVGRKRGSDGAPVGASTRAVLRGAPEQVFPIAKAPYQLVSLRTSLPRLLEGNLAPGPHSTAIRLLVAKIGAQGAGSYYTRRSSSIETFTLDEIAALMVPLCDGAHSLAAIADLVAGQAGKGARGILHACVESVGALLDGAVLDLRGTSKG
jgi:hypothetical protein